MGWRAQAKVKGTGIKTLPTAHTESHMAKNGDLECSCKKEEKVAGNKTICHRRILFSHYLGVILLATAPLHASFSFLVDSIFILAGPPGRVNSLVLNEWGLILHFLPGKIL